MTLSRWSISNGAYEAVRLLSNNGSIIVEFGSGEGTERLARLGKVYSVESDQNWILNYSGVEYIHAPLKKVEPISGFNHTHWYDLETIKNILPNNCDIVIVDGPLGSIGRSGLLRNLFLFPKDTSWVIDDTNREEEAKIADYIALKHSLHCQKFWNFTVLTREPLGPKADIIRGASIREFREEDENYIHQFYPAWGQIK